MHLLNWSLIRPSVSVCLTDKPTTFPKVRMFGFGTNNQEKKNFFASNILRMCLLCCPNMGIIWYKLMNASSRGEEEMKKSIFKFASFLIWFFLIAHVYWLETSNYFILTRESNIMRAFTSMGAFTQRTCRYTFYKNYNMYIYFLGCWTSVISTYLR